MDEATLRRSCSPKALSPQRQPSGKGVDVELAEDMREVPTRWLSRIERRRAGRSEPRPLRRVRRRYWRGRPGPSRCQRARSGQQYPGAVDQGRVACLIGLRGFNVRHSAPADRIDAARRRVAACPMRSSWVRCRACNPDEPAARRYSRPGRDAVSRQVEIIALRMRFTSRRQFCQSLALGRELLVGQLPGQGRDRYGAAGPHARTARCRRRISRLRRACQSGSRLSN